MSGSSTQSINDAGSSPIPEFRYLKIDNSADVILNVSVTILDSLDLTQGNIITTATNILVMDNGSKVTSVSDASYVQGPVRKIGDNAFTFPVGDNGNYQPVSITAPAAPSDAFTAEYIEQDPHPTYDKYSKDLTIDHVSTCEYWIVDRTS